MLYLKKFTLRMRNKKVSFITTVYNEEDGIKQLLNSLQKQTKMPDEILIVDAKSMDGTVKELNRFKNMFGKTNFQIISKKGNRSVGRNTAIERAKGGIIVVTDAGCIVDKHWLKRITTPFQNSKADVVAGFYRPVVRNTFEKCLSCYTCVMPDKVTADFLPSSRSIAFRKEAWKKAGGYPENLDTCEDLFFARKMKRLGFKFIVEKKAIVYWPQRKNIFQATKQFYSYAKGDGEALYIRRQTPFLFLRGIIFLSLIMMYINTKKTNLLCMIVALFFIYISYALVKSYRYIGKPFAIIYLPLLQLTSDAVVIIGMSFGIVLRFLLRTNFKDSK